MITIKLLILLEYKSLKYYHNDKNIETNKNDLICFIKKIVQYNNTLKNIHFFHNYKRNPIKLLNKRIGQYQYISLIKIQGNIKTFHIFGKLDPL